MSTNAKKKKTPDQVIRLMINLLNEEMPYRDLVTLHQGIRYVVSLDIGGGNCSAAVLDVRKMDSLKGEDKANAVKPLYTQPNEFFTPSAVGYKIKEDGEEEVLIGREAANEADFLFTNYKTVPAQKNLEAIVRPDGCLTDEQHKKSVRQLMTDYIRALYNSILGANSGTLGSCARSEILIMVGVPSGGEWKTEEARNNYKDIIIEATGGDPEKKKEQVWLFSESTAPILYLLGKYPQPGKDRLMIIDLGAYSADITYIDRITGKRLEMSVRLGGKNVDQIIRQYVRTNMTEKQKRKIRENVLDYFVRVGKEEFWPKAKDAAEFYVCGDEPVVLDVKMMNECVAKNEIQCESRRGEETSASYTEHLEHFLDDFVISNRDVGIRPDVMLITGGAANMRPAYDAILEFCANTGWIEAGMEVYPGPDGFDKLSTSRAVPMGMLLYYAKTMMYVEKLPAVCEELKADMITYLRDPLGADLASNLPDFLLDRKKGLAVKAARRWKNEGSSYDDLAAQVSLLMKDDDDAKAFFERKINRAVDLYVERAQQSMSKAVVQFMPSGVMVDNQQKTAIAQKLGAVVAEDAAKKLKPEISRAVAKFVAREFTEKMLEIVTVILLTPFYILVVPDAVREWWERLNESEEEKNARKEKELEEKREQRKQERIAHKKEMAQPRTSEEREKLYRLISGWGPDSILVRPKAKKKIREELPGILAKVFAGKTMDDMLSALLDVLHKEQEKAAFM